MRYAAHRAPIAVAVPLNAPMKMVGSPSPRPGRTCWRPGRSRGAAKSDGRARRHDGHARRSRGGGARSSLLPLLIGKDCADHHLLMLQRALTGNTGAHSAVEMALLDLAGRAPGEYASDRSGSARPLRTRARHVAARQCHHRTQESPRAQAGQRGARISTSSSSRSASKQTCRRDAGGARDRSRCWPPDCCCCADANCGLTYVGERRYAERTRDADLMFIEQPLPADDVAGLKALARATENAD